MSYQFLLFLGRHGSPCRWRPKINNYFWNIYTNFNYYIYLKMMTSSMNIDPLQDIKYQENTDILNKIDESDKQMLGYVARLYEALNGEKLDFEKINNAVDALQAYNAKNEYHYLNNLLHPEKCKGVKIPSQIPVPSCSFQLHNCVTLRTNASGNLGVIFNPYFLATNDYSKITNVDIQYEGDNPPGGNIDDHVLIPNFFSSLFVNNDNTLTGYEANDNWVPINIGQCIPPVYDQYRLVSASITMKYIGRLDTVSGVIGGSVIFDESDVVGGNFQVNGAIVNGRFNSFPKSLSKYGNFDLAMDAFYHQENLCLNGMRCLYFPVDNSYEEYTKVLNSGVCRANIFAPAGVDDPDHNVVDITVDESYLKNGFRNMIYVLGAPANQACFKLDIYCNFECLPTSNFLNYLPLSMSTEFISGEQKRRAALIVQQTPIGKADDENKNAPPTPVDQPGILKQLKKKFMDGLPNIVKIAGNALTQSIPGLQLGTVLANSMQLLNKSTPP